EPVAPQTTSPEPSQSVVEPNFNANDPYLGNGWHLYNFASPSFSGATADADIYGRDAWDITLGSSNVIIAVLDDGVDILHPDLDAKIVSPYDAVTGDNNPSPLDDATPSKSDGHGTMVYGLAA